MPASFEFTLSTPVRLASYDSALRLIFNVREMEQLPCPIIGSVYVDTFPDNRFAIRNEDYGLLIDDEEENNFDVDQQNVWDRYLSEGLGNKDWREAVEEIDYAQSINVTAEQLERLMQLSIQYGRAKAPLEPCDGDSERFRINFSGSSDDEPVYFSLDVKDFSSLVVPDETYYVQSISTPSTDTDLCYAKVAFYQGPRPLKVHDIDLSGIDFSNGELEDSWELVSEFFNNMPSPDALLEDFLVQGRCLFFDEFTDCMSLVVQSCTNRLTAVKICMGIGRIEAAAQITVSERTFLHEAGQYFLFETARKLSKDFPVAATIVCRDFINDALDGSKKGNYAIAADCLALISDLSLNFDADSGRVAELVLHKDYVEKIKKRHGRKATFWSMTKGHLEKLP